MARCWAAASRIWVRPVAATGQPRKISAFYELSTNDLYLLSYFGNRNGGLNFGQTLVLTLGVKVDI